jgi:hypothetical protein
MATTPSYTTDYMKRIAFLDGQVLHDFHLNIMQKNIAEAIKLKTTRDRYDFYLLVSPYNTYYHEPFVNTTDQDPESTAVLNNLTFSVNSGTWVTTLLELPAVTDEICLVSNFEDFPSQGATVNFYYRAAVSDQWIPILPDQPEYLGVSKKYFQIKVECIYTGTVRPTVFDFALLWK